VDDVRPLFAAWLWEGRNEGAGNEGAGNTGKEQVAPWKGLYNEDFSDRSCVVTRNFQQQNRKIGSTEVAKEYRISCVVT
jgi:hypothetical protein